MSSDSGRFTGRKIVFVYFAALLGIVGSETGYKYRAQHLRQLSWAADIASTLLLSSNGGYSSRDWPFDPVAPLTWRV